MTTKPNLSAYWLNILFLALAIFFANLWLKYHLGGESTLIILANALIAIYGIAFSLLGKTIGEDGQNEISSRIQQFFWILLRPGFLVTIYLVFIMVGSLYASVSLVNDTSNSSMEIEVFPWEDQKSEHQAISISGSGEIVKEGFFTTPFGRVMTLQAKGYRDYTFELYPFVGKKIMLDEVLIPLPSIWVRSYPTIVNLLLDNCQLAIVDVDGLDTLFNQQTQNTFGSYIIGEPQSVKATQLDQWQREASAYYKNEGPELSNTLLKWSNAKFYNETLDLKPQKEYKAILSLKSNGKVLGIENFIVNKNDALIEVLLKQPKNHD